MSSWKVDIAGKSYDIPTLALAMMLAAILMPPVKYALTLVQPTPAELLVAISISMFASVLFLWILDATSLLPFRSAWISRSVYTAAIVSILGTSVGVYGNYFAERKYPYEGEWLLTVQVKNEPRPLAERSVILIYSSNSEAYWGYSRATVSPADGEPVALEVARFLPIEKEIDVRLISPQGIDRVSTKLEALRRNKLFRSVSDESRKLSIELARKR